MKEKTCDVHVGETAADTLISDTTRILLHSLSQDWYDDGEDFENLSKSIADKIRQRVKVRRKYIRRPELKRKRKRKRNVLTRHNTTQETLNVNRYKLVVQVTLGQMKDQGVRITSRCLWDTQTDNYASIDYKNEFIWGSAMVFGLYAE